MSGHYPFGECRATISDQLSRICKSMSTLRNIQTHFTRNSIRLWRPEDMSKAYKVFHFHTALFALEMVNLVFRTI